MIERDVYTVKGQHDIPLDFMARYIEDATNHYHEEEERILEYYIHKYCYRKIEIYKEQYTNEHYLMIYTPDFTVMVYYTLGLDLTDFIHPGLDTHIKYNIKETII